MIRERASQPRTGRAGAVIARAFCTLAVAVLALMLGAGAWAAPQVSTDLPDYAPGDTVQIAGSGFHAGEVVTLQVTHTDATAAGGNGHAPWTVTTDAAGSFTASWYVDPDDSRYSSFRLTADCPDGLHAETTFTDVPRVGSVSVSVQGPNPVAAGDSATYTITVNRDPADLSTIAFTAEVRVVSGLPPGATASSLTVGFTRRQTSSSGTLTVTTTSATPGGNHAFTVKASVVGNPLDFAVGSGRLSVAGAADTIAPTTTATRSADPNAAGWNKADVTVHLSAVDNDGGSGVKVITYSYTGAQSGGATVTGSSTDAVIAAEGTTTLTYFATDNAGNVEPAKTLTVRLDKTAPILMLPAGVTAEATGPDGAAVSFSAGVTDNLDPAVTANCSSPSGSTFPLGTTTVTCSTTDAAGNPATGSFTVTVQDTTPPAVTVPADITAEATSAAGAAVSFTAGATDLVDGAVSVSASPASGSIFPLGETTVTVMATDAHGNSVSKSFKVAVVDTTAPAITVPAALQATATSAAGAVVYFAASATDLVDGAVAVTYSSASGSLCGPGTTTVTCTASDAHGNRATKSFTVTVTFSATGCLPPISADGSSVFKLGRTVPVKFRLTGASAGIPNLVATLHVSRINDSVTGIEAEAGSTSAADVGNNFRYDAAGDQYIFNLGTQGLSPGTWQLRIDLGDGVVRTVRIGLRN
jgi:hypothetical protein